MDRSWETGFTVPFRAKLALFLLSLFAIAGIGFPGYKMESIPLISLAVLLSFFIWGAAFYKTWLHVDESKETVTIKKRFFLTWQKTFSYRGKYLQRDSSPAISQDYSSRPTGSNEIYLTGKHATRGELLFSSSVSEDYFRVIDYLGSYIKVK
ncbi:hypothetical protein [Microbulbifer mangrovi]|uniref:hypothetical protein n=1 Tax=Microbulbifer mangrovi TaxID=927787 RepID=UPI00117F05DC|nr:hypothetical protein [Microbulbifer mangrovi]